MKGEQDSQRHRGEKRKFCHVAKTGQDSVRGLMFVTPQVSCVKILPPNVIILGGRDPREVLRS